MNRFKLVLSGAPRVLLVATGVVACACTAQITGDGSSPVTAGSSASGGAPAGGTQVSSGPLPTDRDLVANACRAKSGVIDTGRTPLRRLTRGEIDNSVRALLQVEAGARDKVTPDEKMGAFYSNAVAPVDDLTVAQYQELAVRVAQAALPRMATIAGCDLAASAACADSFVEGFGRRAYRRPLAASEKAALLGLFELGKGAGGVALGFQTVLEAVLQSPFFLYHDDTYVSVEGAPQHPSAKPLPLDPYALAARLSFFLVGSTPDDELLGAASKNELGTAEQLAAQSKRLLESDAASETIGNFHRQWLGVGDLKTVDRVSPLFSPSLLDAAYEETKLFASYVLRQGDGKLSTLLTSNLAFPSGPLFAVYGVTEPAGYRAGTPVSLDATQRAGLLTQSAFLMDHSHSDQTSPVHRGIAIRENILCGTIAPPPANLVVVVPPVTPSTSTRERFAQHEASPVCGACHKDLDPLGLGFENYDQVGAYRTVDGLGPVDASGTFTSVRPDLAGPFVGAVQMAQALAKSTEVADCATRQWLRFALGRIESEADACTVSGLQSRFESSGGNVPELLADVVASEAFKHVRSTGENR
ncbi:MAG TPA: DUF1588 domain-containing protein [Polyangiaceae bacterium]|nr:DUF1588 domain-containing protein [Polyangiaceae bacterium]